MSLQEELEISIVSTVYNDAELVTPLVNEIERYINPLNVTFEIILVNDFSTDNSLNEIERICQEKTHVKAISLARNHGQQIAMSVGIEHSYGKYVIIMDGDLQNPPSAIPDLYQKIKEGFDIVYTVSNVRNNFLDEFTSRLCWFVLNTICSCKFIPNQLMMKIMTQHVAQSFKGYQEHYRTITGLIHDINSNHTTLEVENQKRTIGQSHYNFFKRLDLMLDLIVSTSNKPLNVMMYTAILTFLFSLILSFRYIIDYMIHDILPGFTSLILVNLIIGSLIMTMLAFIGKYLANIYQEVKRRPLYHISKKINFSGDQTNSSYPE